MNRYLQLVNLKLPEIDIDFRWLGDSDEVTNTEGQRRFVSDMGRYRLRILGYGPLIGGEWSGDIIVREDGELIHHFHRTIDNFEKIRKELQRYYLEKLDR